MTLHVRFEYRTLSVCHVSFPYTGCMVFAVRLLTPKNNKKKEVSGEKTTRAIPTSRV